MKELTCDQMIVLLKIFKGYVTPISEDYCSIQYLIHDGLLEKNKNFRPELDFPYSVTKLGEKRIELALLSF